MAKTARHTRTNGCATSPSGPGGFRATRSRRWRASAITLVGVALLAVIVLAIPPLRHGVVDAIGGDTTALRAGAAAGSTAS